MLQANKVQSDTNSEPMTLETSSGHATLQSFLSFVRRQFAVILFVTLLALALGVIYVATTRPSYTAQAQLLIDARKVQVFQQQSVLGDSPIDAAQVESQAEILKSENIAAAVIKNLHLTNDPEFVGSGGGLIGALVGLVFGGSDKAASDFELFRSAVRTFQGRLTIRRLGLSYVIQIGFWSYDAERAAEIANAVADAYVTDQLEAKYQATRRASVWLQDRIKELRDQVSAAERAVVDFKTQNNIVSTGGPDKRLLGEQQVAELTSQLVIARANTAEAKARLDRIESVLSRTDSPFESFGSTVADTLKNEVVTKLRTQYLELAARESDWTLKYGRDHLAVVNIRNQLREIRNSIFEELKRLGETYKSDYAIAKQREVGVQQELSQAVSGSQATDAKSVTLRELQSTAQTYKTIYDNFLQRYMEAVQQQSFPITEARLISSAARPLNKSHPRTLLDLAVACLGGIALGFGIGALRDMSDRVFRSAEQVESLLRTECISLVPLVTADAEIRDSDDAKAKLSPSSLKAAAPGQNETWAVARTLVSRSSEAIRSLALVSDLHGTIKSTKGKINTFTSSVSDRGTKPAPPAGFENAGPRTIVRGDSPGWMTVDAPLSRYTEAIRAIKLANDLSGTVKANRVVGFTSSLPNEGKSTIAFSLAQLMSQVGARTILVDCDLRNPSLTREFAPRTQTGLLDVMAGRVSLEEAVWKDPSTKLTFLPVISKFRMAHSSEVLGSPALRKLFEQLRENYDFVVVDLPPLAPIVDVRAATHLVDSFVFVIEWGRTKIDVAQYALGHAQGVYESLLGVVVNKVDMNVFGRYASHRDDVYYNKYYSRYGYTE
jgi:polysaccharide biosynthesis transport protein